jgi:lysophospholipid hydrolase
MLRCLVVSVHILFQVVTRLIHLLGQRILGSLGSRSTVSYSSALSEFPNKEPRSTVANLSTVAVLPASDSVPLSSFTLELQFALSAIGRTLRLSSDIVQSRLGAAAFDPINDYRLSSWLSHQEDVHRMVLYECDRRLTHWTQRCIRQVSYFSELLLV